MVLPEAYLPPVSQDFCKDLKPGAVFTNIPILILVLNLGFLS